MTDENPARSGPAPGDGPEVPAPELAVPAAPRRAETSARLDPLIGQRLASYEILSRVARGGMGVVYRARHVYIDKIVAVKVLDPALAQRADLIDRFRTEAQSLARVEHENVVKVIDILEDKGHHFIVMDFAEGANLRTIVKEQGPLAPHDLLSVARQTAEALYAAHREGILHRDIKPENLIRNARGRCKLADFGLAGDLRLIAEGHEGPLNFGTPAYSAPEVLRRLVPDKRSDIFSFGATMYHLATGDPPFGHSGLSQIMLRQKHGAELLDSRRPDLPPKLCALIMNCLAYDPKDRPESFAEILERLPRRAHTRAAVPGATPTETADLLATASAPLPAAEPETTPSSRLISIGVLVLAVFAALLVMVLAWNQWRGANPAANAAPANAIAVNDVAPAPDNTPRIVPPANNAPPPAFLPEDEAFAASELDSRTAMSKADYVSAWEAYDAFLRKYPASRHAETARQQQREVLSRVQQLREQEYRKARDASEEALRERRTADAIASLDRFPPELLRPLFPGEEIEAAQRLETQRQVVIAAEAGDLARVLEQADALRKAWRDEAEKGEGLSEIRRLRSAANLLRTRELLEQFLPGRTADAQEKVNKRLAELRRQLEAAHQNALVPTTQWRQFCGGLRAEWALAGAQLFDSIVPLLVNREFEPARRQVDAQIERVSKARAAAAAGLSRDVAARAAERKEVEDLLRRLREDIQLAERCNLAVAGAVRRLKSEGKSTEFRAHDGFDADSKRSTRVVRVMGRVVATTASEVEIDDGDRRVSLRLDMLTVDTVRALVKPSRVMDEHLSLVAWLVALGRVDLAETEEARILRMPELTTTAQSRMRELVGGGRLAFAAWRRLSYMAAAAGKLTVADPAAAFGTDSIEARMLAAQQACATGTEAAAAAYVRLVGEIADPELVHLEIFARALVQAKAGTADLRNRLMLEPWDANVHAQLARALRADGDTEQARLEAQRALLIDPSHEDAWALLKELG
ncbi:MAG: protein kinase [Planctomycetes bacterium]|nr:protein kinase [Planctomycetota bacterium]MCL4729087.1 protein kinase [Planctomycetota bacterium]